uniref:G-protein coupled receptors family 2 profile 2 domain-containing protein n=1 Tax=Strigamia maritima TaxID=126957 RepID=T1JHT8_STRMM
MYVMDNYSHLIRGFTVSVLYCFLNGDVRNSIARHWRQWRQRRSLNCSRKSVSCSGLEAANKLLSDGGTSLKMDSKRDTCVSCLTTTSHLGNGYSQAQTCPSVTDTH